jgi:hypothetical protein
VQLLQVLALAVYRYEALSAVHGAVRQELREGAVNHLVIPFEDQEVRCALNFYQELFSCELISAYSAGCSCANRGSCSPTTSNTGTFTRFADARFHPAST